MGSGPRTIYDVRGSCWAEKKKKKKTMRSWQVTTGVNASCAKLDWTVFFGSIRSTFSSLFEYRIPGADPLENSVISRAYLKA